MKVEDRNVLVRIADGRRAVSDVLGDQVLRMTSLGDADDFGHPLAPLRRDAAEIGLVADFVVDVLGISQLFHDLFGHQLFDRGDLLVFARVDFQPRRRTDLLHVVRRIERMDGP